METNALPRMDMSVTTTACCPKFNPVGWDGRKLHFKDKPFVRATTCSLLHAPINMAKAYSQARIYIKEAAAEADGHTGESIFIFYTTCPKFACKYGKNHVIGVAEI